MTNALGFDEARRTHTRRQGGTQPSIKMYEMWGTHTHTHAHAHTHTHTHRRIREAPYP